MIATDLNGTARLVSSRGFAPSSAGLIINWYEMLGKFEKRAKSSRAKRADHSNNKHGAAKILTDSNADYQRNSCAIQSYCTVLNWQIYNFEAEFFINGKQDPSIVGSTILEPLNRKASRLVPLNRALAITKVVAVSAVRYLKTQTATVSLRFRELSRKSCLSRE